MARLGQMSLLVFLDVGFANVHVRAMAAFEHLVKLVAARYPRQRYVRQRDRGRVRQPSDRVRIQAQVGVTFRSDSIVDGWNGGRRSRHGRRRLIFNRRHGHILVRHINGFSSFRLRFGFRADGIRIRRVVITVQQANRRQTVNAEMLIQQVPPADVVRALRTFVGRASRTVELSMINVLALVVTDVRTRGATESFSGTLLFRNIILN